jgi:hypothetical protein
MAFKKGQSGNPAGRPKGSRDKRLKWMLSHERALQEKVVQDALDGNTRAMQIVADRLWPKLRSEALPIKIKTDTTDLAEQGRLIIQAALDGKIPPDVVRDVLTALYGQARLVELTELEERLAALEKSKHLAPWERRKELSPWDEEGDEAEIELLPIRGKRRRAER